MPMSFNEWMEKKASPAFHAGLTVGLGALNHVGAVNRGRERADEQDLAPFMKDLRDTLPAAAKGGAKNGLLGAAIGSALGAGTMVVVGNMFGLPKSSTRRYARNQAITSGIIGGISGGMIPAGEAVEAKLKAKYKKD